MAASWTRHPVLAGVIGVVAGALVIALVEWLGQQWLGRGDLQQPATITAPMFGSVLLAWVAGAATAALVATTWCGGRSRVPGFVASGCLFAGSVATMFAFPHPGWMIAGAVLLMPAAAWWGTRGRVAAG